MSLPDSNHFVSEGDDLQTAIRKIDQNAMQIVFVRDEEQRLCGSLSDGDIRRAILQGAKLTTPVADIMNRNPKAVKKGKMVRSAIFQKMMREVLRQLPVVDDEGRVIEVITLQEIVKTEIKNNKVVILAGGLGSRLRPLTDQTPKPLLKVGKRSILEIQVDNFVRQGFQKLAVSVNYKAEMVKEHLNGGRRFGCEITYLEEDTPLGTAGPLTLLQDLGQDPVILMNGDIITRLDFEALLKFHHLHSADLTVCAKEYEVQVPYGVVRINGENLQLDSIEEKPTQKFFVNAGIYSLSPRVIDMIPKGQRFDMPALIEMAKAKDLRVQVYPISEYWLDIGKLEDYHRAQAEYEIHFKDIQ